jgi:hypothetical protein
MHARRQLDAYLSGIPQVRQYERYTVDEDIRDLEWEVLLDQYEADLQFDKPRFREEAQALYDHAQSLHWVDDAMAERVFQRAMNFLGVDYHIDNGNVVLDDTTTLEQGLDRVANS